VLKNSLRLCHLGSYEERVSKHELRRQASEPVLFGEIMPHRAHQWRPSRTCIIESTINVVDEVISAVHGITNRLSDTGGLEPGLTQCWFER